MSINMADVKAIMNTTNSKEIIKIQDSLGNTLWQKSSTPTTTITITLTNWIAFSMVNNANASTGNGWASYPQLTNKEAPSGTTSSMKYIILPVATVQAIKNHTYTTDQTIAGLSVTDWYGTYRGQAYICYIQNNDLYCVGNTDNSTANDTVLGTTNVLSKFRMYYANQSSGRWPMIMINNSTSSSTTKWRYSNANYLINHTTTGKIFMYYQTSPVISDTLTYTL